jgi:hypothetical protein
MPRLAETLSGLCPTAFGAVEIEHRVPRSRHADAGSDQPEGSAGDGGQAAVGVGCGELQCAGAALGQGALLAAGYRAGNRAIDRDAETICLKCLEKEPSRRYESAQALADDLGRYLEDRPIHARPISRPARFWRWCKRNPAVAALAAAILLLLVLSTGVSTSLAIAANREAKRATQQAERPSSPARPV